MEAKHYKLIRVSLFFSLFFLLSFGCGANEKENLEALQNMHNLMWAFLKQCKIPELVDKNKANGYISYSVEPGEAVIHVMLANVKDKKHIPTVKALLSKIAKEEKIKNKIILELYTKLDASGAFVSTNKYETITIP